MKDNVATRFRRSSGDVEYFFNQEADKIVRIEQINQRVAPVPLESRAILSYFDPGRRHLTVWMGTQGPFQTRTLLAKALGLEENRVRVIAPDVGGAFGAKFAHWK